MPLKAEPYSVPTPMSVINYKITLVQNMVAFFFLICELYSYVYGLLGGRVGSHERNDCITTVVYGSNPSINQKIHPRAVCHQSRKYYYKPILEIAEV